MQKFLIYIFVLLFLSSEVLLEDPKQDPKQVKTQETENKNIQQQKVEDKQKPNTPNNPQQVNVNPKKENIPEVKPSISNQTITKEDPKTIKKKSDVVDSFSKEWSKKMLDYESTYVYMIPVAYKQSQTYYENITTVPCRVRGAYILDDEKGVKLDFKIVSPSNKEVYKNTSAAAIFDFELKEAGLYSIIFSNPYKTGEIKPTFTMNTGQNRIVQTKDLAQAENNMEILATFLKSFTTEDKLKRNVIRERRNKLQKNNKYFYTFSVIESIVLVIVSIWQFYYMKNLFEIKGSL